MRRHLGEPRTRRHFMSPPVLCKRPECGQPVSRSAKGYQRVYCSAACKKAWADMRPTGLKRKRVHAAVEKDLNCVQVEALLKAAELRQRRERWQGGVSAWRQP